MSLVDQLRSITSTEDDDYFEVTYLVDLLNRAKDHIIEVGIRMERGRKTSLRFLDPLRVTQTVTFGAFSSYSDFYKTTATKPTDLDEWLSLDLDGVNLIEIGSLFEVKQGNAQPDSFEGYFLVYDDAFEFYLDANSYSNFTLRYIKNSSDLTSTDTEISDLNGGERAVLYYAATLMADTDTTIPAQLFKDQFNNYVQDLIDQ